MRTKFLEQTGARYVRLIQQDLPINPLYRLPNLTENAQVASGKTEGRDKKSANQNPCSSVFICDQNLRVLRVCCPLSLSVSSNSAPVIESHFLSFRVFRSETSEILRFAQDDSRQGRSWAFPVWLASQDAGKFVTGGEEGTSCAQLAECGVHFSPHTFGPADQRLVLGTVVHQPFKKAEAALCQRDKLQTTGLARQLPPVNPRRLVRLGLYDEDGLLQSGVRYGSIASNTSGRIGVVAL